MHSAVSTGVSFAILIGVVGFSFYYVGANPPELPQEPWVGITGTLVTPAIANEIGLSEARGFLTITVEPQSPADKAGLRGGSRPVDIGGEQILVGGDVILSINGNPIFSEDDITQSMQGKGVGDTIKLTISRGGAIQDVSLVLEPKP